MPTAVMGPKPRIWLWLQETWAQGAFKALQSRGGAGIWAQVWLPPAAPAFIISSPWGCRRSQQRVGRQEKLLENLSGPHFSSVCRWLIIHFCSSVTLQLFLLQIVKKKHFPMCLGRCKSLLHRAKQKPKPKEKKKRNSTLDNLKPPNNKCAEKKLPKRKLPDLLLLFWDHNVRVDHNSNWQKLTAEKARRFLDSELARQN